MTLDISPLRSAIPGLDEGLARYLTDTSDTQIREFQQEAHPLHDQIQRRLA